MIRLRINNILPVFLFPVLVGLLVSCSDLTPPASTSSELMAESPLVSITPTSMPSATFISPPTAVPSLTPTIPTQPTIQPGISPEPSNTPEIELKPCSEPECYYSGAFFLQRPIASSENDKVDVTYRFGSTQGGRRDPHHGVEFLNGHGTPVLAAGDGKVVVAGGDQEPYTERGVWPFEYYGPYGNFYGNLVVIEHVSPPEIRQQNPQYAETIYTVYGHLSEILVEEGQDVIAGEEIGKVGLAGIAEGSHLHFEVRESENKYQNSRNPELYLQPHQDENGNLNGGMAVSIKDAYGQPLEVESIVLEFLAANKPQSDGFEISLQSYAEKALLGMPPWHDSFGVSDIPPGTYRVSFPYYGLKEYVFEVLPGQLTLLTLNMK